ncbi:MAG: hypothetical protein IT525_00395 [Nitrosomonas sp.]|jgi:hypothetical protein|nr:hypothetical protein [Nitrosomonas sp.]
MKLVNITGTFLILTFSMMSGPLYAQSETSIIKSFRNNAAGIATSSLSVRQIKEKLLKLRNDSPSLSSNTASFNPAKKKIESK